MVLVAAYILIISLPVGAFGIKPVGTERGDTIIEFEVPAMLRIWYPNASRIATAFFTTPVHERATNMIYGCNGDIEECSGNRGMYSPVAVLDGNQWNDNPPFKLESTNTRYCKKYIGQTLKAPYHPLCWYLLFRDGEKGASEREEFYDARSGNVILYRVHFGDMQFLHSMASGDGEEAQTTKNNIMMWTEFTYKIAVGQISRDVVLNQSGIDGMKELFFNRGWTAQQLFIRDDGTYHADKDFRNFVFGSLLHLVQDSFTLSHTDRDVPSGSKCVDVPEHYKPGIIRSFHSYAGQDKEKHKREDMQAALSANIARTPPSAVDVGKTLKGYYESNTPWEEVKKYLDCVFELENTMAIAGPGNQFLPD